MSNHLPVCGLVSAPKSLDKLVYISIQDNVTEIRRTVPIFSHSLATQSVLLNVRNGHFHACCDVTPESRNNGVGAGRPLPGSGSVNT
jgi:hypothetical protein